MSLISRVICIILYLTFLSLCLSQDKINETVIHSIEIKIEKELHHHYDVRILDVNNSLNNPSISGGRIKDPYKNLKDCFIFLAASLPDSNLNKPKGFVGIYKIDTILWRSASLIENLSTLGGFVTALDDFNKDGKVEIVVSENELPNAITANYLWIFTWDGKMGECITELDEDGESRLAFMGRYHFKDVDGDGIYEIQGKWYKNNNFDNISPVTYCWNGKWYGNWGKSSKYLLKGKN